MYFTWDHETVEFRKQVRAFLHGETGIAGTDGTEVALHFQSKLAKLGWLTMAWPREYGGGAASHLKQLVYNEEMSYADAPSVNHGVQWVGPTLMLHGSEEQRERYLPPIARAEEFWCTLYSEPGAGSDLASLQTRAVSSGDDFIINGQKIWTGRAHYARYGWLAARTDPEAPKHRGITLFIVDMQLPGVSIRPLLDLSGRHHFNEVFFEDVRVPRANIVGELNRGWYYIAVALDFERSGIQNFATARRVVEQLSATPTARRPLAPVLRHELAERAIEVAVGTNLAYRVALMQARGELPNQESSASRVFGTELIQRTALTAMRISGMCGQVRAPLPFGGRDVATPYLIAASESIAGGTSEIQRNIIATRGLGLPRA